MNLPFLYVKINENNIPENQSQKMHENNRLTAKTSRILLRAEFINLKQKQAFYMLAKKIRFLKVHVRSRRLSAKRKDKRLEYKAVKKEGD